jgi:hypothetical protein
MYAKESVIDYNAPHRAHNTLFITKPHDQYFLARNYKNMKTRIWRFFRFDSIFWRRSGDILPQMLKNMLNGKSGLGVMNACVNDALNLCNATHCCSACTTGVFKHRHMGNFLKMWL